MREEYGTILGEVASASVERGRLRGVSRCRRSGSAEEEVKTMQVRRSECEMGPLWRRHVASISSDERMEGRYDPDNDVWMVATGQGSVPAATCGDPKKKKTRTLTAVRRETTDTD